MPGIDPVPPSALRNVVLLGHGGTGKTSLAEALLELGGAGSGRGGTFDFDPEERARGHSLALATASLPWRDHRITILDTPGGADAVGDCYAALRAADVALFVVDAAAGVQAQHDQLWEACETIGLPRVVLLNKLDRDNAAFQRNVDALRERYGKPLAPVHMPIGVGREFGGVIDLLHEIAVVKIDGKRTEVPIPDERREQAAANRALLVEAIVENDDGLLERYLEGEVPGAQELAEVFAHGIATCGFFPVLCASVDAGIGVRLLADFIVEECPPPTGTEGGPTAVYVAKTLSDPYVGRISVLRVVSGAVAADDELTCARTGQTVRLHQLLRLQGKEQSPISRAGTGEVFAVAKLEDVRTGDTLRAAGADILVEPVAMPEPQHRVRVAPSSTGDEDKLSSALGRLEEEDPALRVERDPDDGALVLRTLGPTHVDVALERLVRKFGVHVEQSPVRHVKQSGGHGQYGIASIEVRPLPRGEGFVFENRIVGGVIPGQFIPSVEKGVRAAMADGVLAGHPMVDVAVTLVDGKHHSVDSSQMAFEIAGSLALLEPVMEVSVLVPDDLLGDVLGDLSARRGRIQGTEAVGAGRTCVVAHVPEAELLSYVGELRSLTSGTGTCTMRFDHYDEVPDHLAKRLTAELAGASAG
jgi:elongation factor G